jgi:hypothetical protein
MSNFLPDMFGHGSKSLVLEVKVQLTCGHNWTKAKRLSNESSSGTPMSDQASGSGIAPQRRVDRTVYPATTRTRWTQRGLHCSGSGGVENTWYYRSPPPLEHELLSSHWS